MTHKHRLAALFVTLVAATVAARAEPTTGPSVVQASDVDAIAKSLGKEIVVEGVCSKADWSTSGKVMNIGFRDADKAKFGVVAFVKIKDKLDAAFGGDAAKALSGAKVRVRGTVSKYGGRSESLKDSTQIVISDPAQVTILEPASGGAATTAPAAPAAAPAAAPETER